ncbi:MAG: hypothetical protein HC854_07750 [Flavobacterium sp.]|nr:hypothetical protein [Flavobacterium sp.]
MKKAFGILLLIIGLIITNIGVGGMVKTETERKNQFNQVVNGFVEDLDLQNSFARNYEKDIAIAVTFIVVGLLLFIIGIILTATKTKKQRNIEMELLVIKNMQNNKTIV